MAPDQQKQIVNISYLYKTKTNMQKCVHRDVHKPYK